MGFTHSSLTAFWLIFLFLLLASFWQWCCSNKVLMNFLKLSAVSRRNWLRSLTQIQRVTISCGPAETHRQIDIRDILVISVLQRGYHQVAYTALIHKLSLNPLRLVFSRLGPHWVNPRVFNRTRIRLSLSLLQTWHELGRLQIRFRFSFFRLNLALKVLSRICDCKLILRDYSQVILLAIIVWKHSVIILFFCYLIFVESFRHGNSWSFIVNIVF